MTTEEPPVLLARLRRVLNHPVSVGALLEIALLGAIPYLAIGAVVASIYGEGQHQMQVEQGSDALVALMASIISWPVLLFSHSCAM
ncbi:MAG: hypothetical protein ACRDTV_04575 [Mycobacterium sp.]